MSRGAFSRAARYAADAHSIDKLHMPNSPRQPAAPAGPTAHGSGTTIVGLQGLRFIAAAMVVVTHVLNREVNLYHPYPIPRAPWTEAGVDIFFVISGFIMVRVVKPELSAGRFWLQRFTRIAPLYWLATAIAFAGGLVFPEWFFGRQSWSFALRSALFLPMGVDANARPLISPGWTLIYEFAFYTVLALCLTVRRPPFALTAVVIGANLVFGMLVVGRAPGLAFYADDLLMLEFLFGFAVAWTIGRLRLAPWQGLGIAAIGLVLIVLLWDVPGAYPRGVKIGIPASLVVFGFLATEPLWQTHRWLQRLAWLGDASYSIYVVHFFLVTAAATLAGKSAWVHDTLGAYGFIAASIAAGLGSGVLAHLFVEKPLLRLVRSWLPARRPVERGSGAAAQV